MDVIKINEEKLLQHGIEQSKLIIQREETFKKEEAQVIDQVKQLSLKELEADRAK